MSKHTPGQRLIVKALGDSYYPDLGQTVNAERMIELIDADSLIAAAPEMLEALKEAVASTEYMQDSDDEIEPGWRVRARHVIAKAEGRS